MMTLAANVGRMEAAGELLRRRTGRRSLMDFTRFTFPTYKPEPVHELIAQHMDAVVEGVCKRLMIFAPPQHGKSELGAVRLPAFWMGRRSDEPVILTSYGAGLAESKSRQARDVVESEEYGRLFNITVRRDIRNVQRWGLDRARGGLLAVGVGGPVTGQGAGLGIIDDPFRNWEQAQSLNMRNKVWDWWRGTFRTRIWEGGAVVLIMTRWHEDDLAGRLLGEQGKEWTVLRLPAIAESEEDRDRNERKMARAVGQVDPLGRAQGDALSPGRYSREELGRLRQDVGSLVWAAEYQGAPTLPEGNRFKRAWFKVIEAAHSQGRRVRFWDKAATEGGGAYTAGVLMCEHEGIFVVEDVVRGQWGSHNRQQIMLQTAQLDGPGVQVYIEQEPGSSGKDSVMAEISLLRGYSVRADRPTGDKDVRMEPFAAQCEAGNVRMLRGAWNGQYLDELTSIPNGKYRDQADSTSGSFNKLALMGPVAATENPFYE